jgi:glutamate N-acetyltransferase / amino-acid N-acetyltransferase
LPVQRLIGALPTCLKALSPDGWQVAADGIMTTDTVPKGASRRLSVNGHSIAVTGIAKGSGMIRPDMATMLAFVATDVGMSDALLGRCLREAVAPSFNRITVDGDTSTNDACILLATGRSDLASIRSVQDNAYSEVATAVTEVCTELAQAIVRDGEGATKFITIEVENAATEADALAVAYTIAHSPLVKTAFSASDPNWGRILAAIGRAPLAQLDVARVSIHLNDLCIVERGTPADDYTEVAGQAVMKLPEFTVRVGLGQGGARARIWTCDLSHEYVRINAEYRT